MGLAEWDAAEEAIMLATCKVWQAFGVAYPSLKYASGHWVTLHIDGQEIPCQCDCTGLLIATIQYMGYDPHWPVGSTGGFGSGLAEATTNFVYDKEGNLSPDWAIITDTSVEPRAGDMRGQRVHSGGKTHSHAAMFVGYDTNHNARGMNGGSSNGMRDSVNVANKYLNTGVFDIQNSAWPVADGDFTSVLRYVKGSSMPGNGWGGGIASDVRALKKLDIYLGLVNPGWIDFNVIKSDGNYQRIEPGYRPVTDFYISSATPPTQATFVFSDLERITVWVGFTAIYLTNKEHRFYLLFTTDGSDPRISGRTVIQKTEEGRLVNDVESSVGFGAYIEARLPFCIRAILKDADDNTLVQAAGTGYFTTQSDRKSDMVAADYVRLMKDYFLDDLDATGKSPNAIDTHPQLYLNDADDIVQAEPYIKVIPGLPGTE